MKKRIITICLIVIVIITGLIICKTKCPPPETYSTCFAIGNTNNVKQPNVNILKEELDIALSNKSEYSLVIIDGESDELSDSGNLKYPYRILDSESNNKQYLNEQLNKMLDFKPQNDEIDILKALDTAASSIDKDADYKKIVVYSSGISTAGKLNFLQNPDWLIADPNDIIELLEKQEALPDLKGIEVIWYGLNHVEGGQNKLDDFQYYRLKCLWAAILKASGAEFEDIDMIFNEKASTINEESLIDKTDFPKVSIVDFDDIIIFTEEDFSFIPGTSKLEKPENVIEILKPIAEDIKNAGYPFFYIIGSTASIDTKEECIRLSDERAETIKKFLCDLGIPEQCLKPYGIGREYIDDDYTWRINDMYSNGNLNSKLAQKNRKVMLIPVDSNSGKEFIEDYNEYFKNN